MTTQVTVRPLCDSLPARLPVLHIPTRTKLEHNLHFHAWSIQIWRVKKNESALLHSWTDKMPALGSTITFHKPETIRNVTYNTKITFREKKYYYLINNECPFNSRAIRPINFTTHAQT